MKIEGLPLAANKIHVAWRAMEKIGKVLKFDADSREEGPKDFLRASVLILVDDPLVPGFYYEFRSGKREWVYLRYEGVFCICMKCGKVGHKKVHCSLVLAQAEAEMGQSLGQICTAAEDFWIDIPAKPLFTNKFIDLKSIEPQE